MRVCQFRHSGLAACKTPIFALVAGIVKAGFGKKAIESGIGLVPEGDIPTFAPPVNNFRLWIPDGTADSLGGLP